MPRLAIAAALAASMTFTPIGAAPAAADNARDIAAVALGALAIYGIAQANKSSSSSKKARVSTKTPPHVARHRFSGPKSYQPVRYGHSIVPLSCLRRAGNAQVISDRCLQEANYQGRLPGNCETWINSSRGRSPAYGANCLAKHGYLIGGRR